MSEFFDPGFRPYLLKPSNQPEKWAGMLDTWGMANEGKPVPSREKRRVAIWNGQKFTYTGEAPVIAVAIESESGPDSVRWYLGIVREVMVGSDSPLIELADQAQYHIASSKKLRDRDVRDRIFNAAYSMFPEHNYPEYHEKY